MPYAPVSFYESLKTDIFRTFIVYVTEKNVFDLPKIQTAMRDAGIGAWLIYDFRGTNPVWKRLIGRELWTTRRLFVWITATGDPKVLVHQVDREQMNGFPGKVELFTNYHEMQEKLADWSTAWKQPVAMEYSPNDEIPTMSIVDAGAFEMFRTAGFNIVSSADLVQYLTARWNPDSMVRHITVSKIVDGIKDAAFDMIKIALRNCTAITDYDVQQFIRDNFKASGLEEEDVPIVSTNSRSGNPHYAPSAAVQFPIVPGDWVLIDLWARQPGDEHIFSDITWTAYAGETVPAKHREVFDTVLAGRDAALKLITDRYAAKKPVYGWELDDAARKTITALGYGKYFIHRTGHSLSPGNHVHGMGANIDNFETRDTRRLIPGTGFTIEPGVYLPEFGVRSEINVYIDDDKPMVTSGVQREIILLG